MVCDTISCGLLGPESVLTNHLRRAELAVRSAARRAVCINPTMQMFVKAEVTPNDSTVSRGTERLRFTPTPFHTDEMMEELVGALENLWARCNIARLGGVAA